MQPSSPGRTCHVLQINNGKNTFFCFTVDFDDTINESIRHFYHLNLNITFQMFRSIDGVEQHDIFVVNQQQEGTRYQIDSFFIWIF